MISKIIEYVKIRLPWLATIFALVSGIVIAVAFWRKGKKDEKNEQAVKNKDAVGETIRRHHEEDKRKEERDLEAKKKIEENEQEWIDVVTNPNLTTADADRLMAEIEIERKKDE